MKYLLTIALLFPFSCASGLPSVEDARSAVAVAREQQAKACSQLSAGPEWAERCHQATKALRIADEALRASQALQKALDADAGSR